MNEYLNKIIYRNDIDILNGMPEIKTAKQLLEYK